MKRHGTYHRHCKGCGDEFRTRFVRRRRCDDCIDADTPTTATPDHDDTGYVSPDDVERNPEAADHREAAIRERTITNQGWSP